MRISDWSSDVCSSDLLGELAVGDRAERRARQVQVMRRRQSEVIVGDAVLRLLALGQCFLGRVVQVPGGIAPGTEVVLVDDDTIPVDQMDRLVVRLDAAIRRAAAQPLERREPDLWILAVGGRSAFSTRTIPTPDPRRK